MSDEMQRIQPEEAMQLILEAVTWENSRQTSSQVTTTVMNPAGLGSYRSFTNGRTHQLIITDFSPEGELRHYFCTRFAEGMAERGMTVKK